jgi:hypothetical protein
LPADFLGEDLIHGLAVQITTCQRTVAIEPQRDVATIISEPRGAGEALVRLRRSIPPSKRNARYLYFAASTDVLVASAT